MTAKKTKAKKTTKRVAKPKVSAECVAQVAALRDRANCTAHTGTRDSLRIDALELLVAELSK